MRWLRDAGDRVGRDFAYLVLGLGTSVLCFVVWVVALSVTLPLLLFVVGVPLVLLGAYAFRWTAEVERHRAALVLGTPPRGHYRGRPGDGFPRLLRDTVTDPQTWRDLAWLVLNSVVGFAFGVIAIHAMALSQARLASQLLGSQPSTRRSDTDSKGSSDGDVDLAQTAS